MYLVNIEYKLPIQQVASNGLNVLAGSTCSTLPGHAELSGVIP